MAIDNMLQPGWYDQDGMPWFKHDGEMAGFVLTDLKSKPGVPKELIDFIDYLLDDVDAPIIDAVKAYAEEHYSFEYTGGID